MKIGKRYWFYASDDAKRIRSGLFTGRFATKGNAIIMEKDGTVWSLPEQCIYASLEEAQSDRRR